MVEHPTYTSQWAYCDNCYDVDTSCTGITWQGGSSRIYCEECGTRTNAAGGRIRNYFNCANCAHQRNCAYNCRLYDFPGVCWKWLSCFRGCCISFSNQPREKRQENTPLLFCGDDVCAGNETPESCPMDCCYMVNSNCTRGAHCSDECCNTPSCCIPNTRGSAQCLRSATWYLYVVTFMLLMVWIKN